jgi:hypothetical protein
VTIVAGAIAELIEAFRAQPDKYEAHRRSASVLERLSHSPEFLTAILADYLRTPDSLDRGHYPVLAVPIAFNPWFSLVANCWIPLPDGNTNLSTKAIHHHGNLLLTTVTLFGPGYRHWTFTTPEPDDEARRRYRMILIESAPHPQHHISFVDRWIAHTPFFPPDLSITLALFSNSLPTTWRDRLKRLPGIRGREEQLRKIVRHLGLTKALDVKTVESFDFYPVEDGFAVMRERKEFELGPNEDHVASLFYILQRSGNEALASIVADRLAGGRIGHGRKAVEDQLSKLRRGERMAPCLSPGHYDRPDANFTGEAIHQALAATA